MILRGGQEQVVFPIDERVNGALLAFQKFLDDHAAPGVAEFARVHDFVDRQRGFPRVLRDDDAFAERQAVGFHDERIAHGAAEFLRLDAVGKTARARGRQAVALHEFLRENLRRFELRGVLRGAEDAQAVALEKIDDARGERVVWADDGEVDALVFGELHERGVLGDFERQACRELRDAGIAGCAKDGADAGRLAQFPDERVFAPAAAEDEDFHRRKAGTLGKLGA